MNASPSSVGTTLADPVRDGLARGWNVLDAPRLASDLTLEADVAIIGPR
jgi:hypothetical protein